MMFYLNVGDDNDDG